MKREKKKKEDWAPRRPRPAPRRCLLCGWVCFQVGGRPGGQVAAPRRPLDGNKGESSTLLPHFHHVSLSLFLLSHSSLPPHDFHQPFTIFSLKSSINPSSSSYSSSISFLEALSLFSFRERNGGGRRPKSSIKFLLSFATQGNSLSSNLHLFHGYGRFFLED